MAQFVTVLRRLFIVPLPAALAYAVGVGALMALAFGLGFDDRWFAYVAYLVSAYGFAAVCATVANFIVNGGIALDVPEDSLPGRLLFDKVFRALATTSASLAVDVLWGVANLAYGIFYLSVWAITLGVLYVCLVVMRAFLLWHARHRAGQDGSRELRLCRRCGIVIMVYALPVFGIVVLNLHEQGTFYYHMYIAIGVATYAFMALGTAIGNFVRYRDGHDLLMFVYSNICLFTVMVSILTMAILMLNVFSDGSEGPFFSYLVVGSLGAVVAIGVFTIGLRLARKR